MIGARITRIAVPRLANRVACQLERRKPRQVTHPLGGHLVDRDPGVNVGAGRLLHPDAGQKRAAGPRMIARPVRAGSRIDLVQAAQDLKMLLDLFKRLQRLGELELFPFLLGPPVPLVHAIGNVDERHSQRRAGRRRCQPGRLGARRDRRAGVINDSKAGRARATPAPRRNARRLASPECRTWPESALRMV